jgi:hypothetical protein
LRPQPSGTTRGELDLHLSSCEPLMQRWPPSSGIPHSIQRFTPRCGVRSSADSRTASSSRLERMKSWFCPVHIGDSIPADGSADDRLLRRAVPAPRASRSRQRAAGFLASQLARRHRRPNNALKRTRHASAPFLRFTLGPLSSSVRRLPGSPAGAQSAAGLVFDLDQPFTLRIPVVAPTPDEMHLKQALKAALVEVLEERSDLLRDVIAEVFEDVAFAHAIREGETSEEVSREEVLRILDSPE